MMQLLSLIKTYHHYRHCVTRDHVIQSIDKTASSAVWYVILSNLRPQVRGREVCCTYDVPRIEVEEDSSILLTPASATRKISGHTAWIGSYDESQLPHKDNTAIGS